MFSWLKNIFKSAKPDFKGLIKEGALIIDVRTPGEYSRGHIENAINIPVDQLSKNLNRLKDKSAPIITCCASGSRSASAQRILNSYSYTNVHNGGGWQSLKQKIN
jgi:phage shock protein E